MSGNVKSNPSYTETELQKFIDELDKTVHSLLPIKNPIDEVITEALNMSYEQIKNISSDECFILCYKLAQYSSYIQMTSNRFKSIRRWADNNLHIMTAKYSSNYGNAYTKFEEKRGALIANDGHAKELYKIWLKYGALEEELNEMSNRIRYISQTLNEVKNVK